MRGKATPYVNVEIGALKIKTLIDTGSQISLLTKTIYDKIVSQGTAMRIISIRKFSLVGAFSDKAQIVVNRIQIDFKIEGKEFVHEFYIVKNITYEMILGIDFLSEQLSTLKCGSEFCVDFPKEHYNKIRLNAITLQDAEKKLNEILIDNAELFEEGIGCVNHYKHKIMVNTKRPFKSKTYPVPEIHRGKVKDHILELKRIGIVKRATT